MATKRQAEQVARRIYGRRRVIKGVRNPSAATADRRDELQRRRKELAGEYRTASTAIRGASDRLRKLRDAARFVIDVDGDPAAIDALRWALVAVERDDANRDRMNDSATERDTIVGRLARRRCEVLVEFGISYRIVASGDSWSDCIERLEAKRKPPLIDEG